MRFDVYADRLARETSTPGDPWMRLTLHHLAARDMGIAPTGGATDDWQNRALKSMRQPDENLDTWQLTDWFDRTFDAGRITAADVHLLPVGSFAMTFRFTLRTPYLSRGVDVLMPTENPILREPVFQTPMVATTSWKGMLRDTMADENAFKATSDDLLEKELRNLFGPPTGENDSPVRIQGAIRITPTFFGKTGREVISPHSRDTKVVREGRGPIGLETVPAKASGWFRAIYVPVDQTRNGAIGDVLAHSLKVLEALRRALKSLLLIRGIGAKTSSGFGLATNSLAEPARIFVRETDGVAVFREIESLPKLTGQLVQL